MVTVECAAVARIACTHSAPFIGAVPPLTTMRSSPVLSSNESAPTCALWDMSPGGANPQSAMIRVWLQAMR